MDGINTRCNYLLKSWDYYENQIDIFMDNEIKSI